MTIYEGLRDAGAFAADDPATDLSMQVQGWALIVLMLTIVLTPVVSWVVLLGFRRAVEARMAGVVPAREGLWRSRAETPPVPGVLLAPSGLPPGPPGTLAALVRRRRRTAVAWYSAAAVAYGVTGALVLLVPAGLLDPLRLATLIVIYAWPWVPTTALLLGLRRSIVVRIVVGYLVLLAAIGALGVEGPRGAVWPLVAWLFLAVPATLLLAGVGSPRLRAAGPHIALVVLLASATLMIWFQVAKDYSATGATATYWLVAGVLVPLLALPVAMLRLVASVRRYAGKRVSEDGLVIDQWWLFFTAYQCLLQLSSASAWFAMAAAYLAYRGVVQVGRRRMALTASARPGPRLLLLRVFAARGRSERLLRELGASWRNVGSVHLIAGTDLATATLEPREFLDFVLGRLSHHFVTVPQDLGPRLARLDVLPDGDGRYRVNDFLCHNDTWRDAVRALVDRTDVVVIDLRGLKLHNHGVTFELQHLVQSRLLHRVCALVDGSTDWQHLHAVLESAAQGSSRWLRAVPIDDHVDIGVILRQVEAATTGVPAPVAHSG